MDLKTEVKENWGKVNWRILRHKNGRAKIELKNNHYPSDRRRRYLVAVDGQWVLAHPNRWIREFSSLADAITKANELMK